jgi:predicted small metal-binding protein
MAKVVHCSDVGFDCDGVVRAETEEEILEKVAEHAETVHNLKEITEELVEQVRAAVRDE